MRFNVFTGNFDVGGGASAPGGGAAWGTITGVLTDQADLASALVTATITSGTITGVSANSGQTIFQAVGGGNPGILKVDVNGNLLLAESSVGATILSLDSSGNPILSNKAQTHSLAIDATGFLIDGALRPVFLTDDTGWTANADGGDKTQSIPSSATLAAMQAALNLAVPGAGDALFTLAQKCKALETALAANLVPNA